MQQNLKFVREKQEGVRNRDPKQPILIYLQDAFLYEHICILKNMQTIPASKIISLLFYAMCAECQIKES